MSYAQQRKETICFSFQGLCTVLLWLVSLTFQKSRAASFLLPHRESLLGCQARQFETTSTRTIIKHPRTYISLKLRTEGKSLEEPKNSDFGRQEFWNDLYAKQASFSWYAGWEDFKPFVDEFFTIEDRILLPGVGNDESVIGMYDDGYKYLTAMDYAPEGIERCRDMLGQKRLLVDASAEISPSLAGNIDDLSRQKMKGVRLLVADARDLQGCIVYGSYGGIVEKGALDAIFLSGGDDKAKSVQNLRLAIQELGQCIKVGGIFMSIAGVVDRQIQQIFDELSEWECLVRQDDLFTTEEGYTSNNIDGSLMVWKRRQP